ncbi:hypothetical protein J0895_22850 [Phormidium pseudopriestleyi FRX01]|uniref:Uncharacterized protein n=1 Tax=Phormidium pseudopriestleyi FRX01 TaxID=1759528 RepID=A0ABS3FZV2_9CYAN|nr:hypothetical protein [Phormidium pseudopriestleyi]MBO0351867.1 hypothetical protein [Phormidium pseudopriestleyi FRX01]
MFLRDSDAGERWRLQSDRTQAFGRSLSTPVIRQKFPHLFLKITGPGAIASPRYQNLRTRNPKFISKDGPNPISIGQKAA